jgi:nicotinamide mononucleotide transporter
MIECIAVIFSLLSVYFGGKNNILTWPTGIVGIVAYSLLFYQNQVFGNAALQIIFLLQSVFGWLKWTKEDKVRKLPRRSVKINISFCITLTLILFYTLYIIGSNSPFMDAITTAISLIGIILMTYRKVDCWYYWILVDIIFVIFFIQLGLYMSAATYFIFLILAIWGLRKWTQISKMD